MDNYFKYLLISTNKRTVLKHYYQCERDYKVNANNLLLTSQVLCVVLAKESNGKNHKRILKVGSSIKSPRGVPYRQIENAAGQFTWAMLSCELSSNFQKFISLRSNRSSIENISSAGQAQTRKQLIAFSIAYIWLICILNTIYLRFFLLLHSHPILAPRNLK